MKIHSIKAGWNIDLVIFSIFIYSGIGVFVGESFVVLFLEGLCESSAKLQATLTEFYEQNEKAANSFTKFVREVLARLKAFFETIINKKSGTAESMLMAKQSAEFVSELQKRYDAALLAMREGNAVRNTQNATEGEKVMRQERYNEDVLHKNARTVVAMGSVKNLTGEEFSFDGEIKLKDRVIDFFDSFGNSVYNKELGDIAVTKSSFRDDKGHGLTHNKVVSFAAIPEVIKNGKIIDVWFPYGKPYQRITIAAPINISGEKYYMGVMIQKDNQTQRMYLHDVITEKATLSFTTEPTTKSEGIRDKGHLFITNILQNALNVNPSDEKTFKQTRRDTEYLDAVKRGDMETAQRMVDEAAKDVGYTVKGYHGTGRSDRVGNVFRPDRATSGPMAFFTDNKDIADNYAKNKADTSIAYDTEYDNYYTQFRVNRNGKNISIPELWNYLSFAEKNKIKEKAGHIKFDDDYESIIVENTATELGMLIL